jgi:hypothetical protein
MGGGIPLSALMLGSAVGGLTKVGLNKAIRGQDYDAVGYDGAKGFAVGSTEILASYGGSALGKHLIKAGGATGGALKGAVSGGFTGSTGSVVKTGLTDSTWDKGVGQGLGKVLQKGMWGGLIGAGVGGAFDGAWTKGWTQAFGSGKSATAEAFEEGVMQSTARRLAQSVNRAQSPIRKLFTGVPKSSAKTEISQNLEQK